MANTQPELASTETIDSMATKLQRFATDRLNAQSQSEPAYFRVTRTNGSVLPLQAPNHTTSESFSMADFDTLRMTAPPGSRRPSGYLNDSIIMARLHMLARDNAATLGEVWIPSTLQLGPIFAHFSGRDDPPTSTSTVRPLRTPTSSPDHIFVVVNFTLHWSLVHYSKAIGNFVCYDGFPGTRDDRLPRIELALRWMFPSYFIGPYAARVELYNRGDRLNQTNGNECGILLLETAAKIIRNRPFRNLPSATIRRLVARDILNWTVAHAEVQGSTDQGHGGDSDLEIDEAASSPATADVSVISADEYRATVSSSATRGSSSTGRGQPARRGVGRNNNPRPATSSSSQGGSGGRTRGSGRGSSTK